MKRHSIYLQALLRRVALCLGILCACLGATGAAAQDRGVYDIRLGNVPVGVFAYSGVEAQGRYSLAGQLRTTGLIGSFTNIRYDAKTVGRVLRGAFQPELYEEKASIGNRESELTIRYTDGVPGPPEFTPPRVSSRPLVDPAEQGDALDLLTALYALFRATPQNQICTFQTFIFDGARRTRISLRLLRLSDTEAVCAGAYRRIEGFSEGELARREVFDFRLVYAPVGDGNWRVAQADVESVYGVVSLERRGAP